MNWTEKYRPQTLDDIVGQDHVIKRLKALVKDIHNGTDGDFPDLFFSGTAGTGKNCAIECFLKDCFGESWRSNLKALNASDERKIDTIRTKVKDAARRSTIMTYITPDGREKNMPFRLIFMDEADALTDEAQGALRRVIEEYSHITRFVFSCNYAYKIIDPIISRCMVFKFRRINPIDMKKILEPIIEKENVKITSEALDEICTAARGDARKGIHLLQNCKLGAEEITIDIVNEVRNNFVDKINMDLILDFIAAHSLNDNSWEKKFDDLWDYMEDLFYKKSMDTKEVINLIVKNIKDDEKMPVDLKRKLLVGAGNAMFRTSFDNDIIHIIDWFWRIE